MENTILNTVIFALFNRLDNAFTNPNAIVRVNLFNSGGDSEARRQTESGIERVVPARNKAVFAA
jgi:hypothetical protein